MSLTSNPLPANVIAAIQRGDKIDAIKLLRDATGFGLKEAKDAVDDYQRSEELEEVATVVMPVTLSPAAAQALKSGNKIEAIRITRSESGLGLRESKMFVESFESAEDRAGGDGSPGEVPSRGNGVWIAVVVVLALVACYWIFGR